MYYFVLHSFNLVLKCVNVLLHSMGMYLLITLYKNGHDSVQKLLVINLSLTEGTISFFGVFILIAEMVAISNGHETNMADQYLSLLRNTGLLYVLFLNMIYISLDRLLEVYLSIKYPIHCTEQRGKYLLIWTWVSGLLLIVGVILAYSIIGYKYEKVFYVYVISPLSLTFLMTAITTFAAIFYKFKETRMQPSLSNRPVTNNTPSTLWVFRNSKFFMSVLLITSFMFLVCIPGLVFLTYSFLHGKRTYLAGLLFMIAFDLSYTCDVFIYIFYQNSVRTLFWKNFRKLGICGDLEIIRDNRTNSTNSTISTISVITTVWISIRILRDQYSQLWHR